MSVIADLIRAGVDPELVARVADELDEARLSSRSKAAIRQERYRNKKRNAVTVCDVTRDVTPPPNGSPYDNNITLTPSLTPLSFSSKKIPRFRKEEFERFYEAYPKRVNRQAAARKFQTLTNSGLDPEKIISAAHSYASVCQTNKTERQFIKAPDVWLNKGCYDDEVLPNGHDPPSISPEEGRKRWREMWEKGEIA